MRYLILCAIALALCACQSKVEQLQEQIQVAEMQAKLVTATDSVAAAHATDLEKLSPQQKIELGGERLMAKLELALYILGITFAVALAAGFFLESYLPNLAKRCFQIAALAGVLILCCVLAYFVVPYIVEYVRYAALALVAVLVGVVIYEVKTHPTLLPHLLAHVKSGATKPYQTPPIVAQPTVPKV